MKIGQWFMQTSTRGRSSNHSTITHRSCATEARDWRVLKRGRHAKSRWKPVVYIYIRYGTFVQRTCSIGDTLQAPSVLNHRQTPQGCRSNSLGVTSIGFIGFVKEQDRRERERDRYTTMRTDRGKCCQWTAMIARFIRSKGTVSCYRNRQPNMARIDRG